MRRRNALLQTCILIECYLFDAYRLDLYLSILLFSFFTYMIIDVVVYDVDKIKLRCFLFNLIISFKLMIKHVRNKNKMIIVSIYKNIMF